MWLILHPAQSNRLWKVLKAWHAVSELWRLSAYCAGGLSIEKTGDADTGWADALAWWRQLWGLGLGGDGAVALRIGVIRSRQTSEEHPNDITSFFFAFSRRHWLSELLLPWLVLLASRAAIAIPLQCFADNVLVAGSQSPEVDLIFDIRLDQTDLIKQRVKPISAGCRC